MDFLSKKTIIATVALAVVGGTLIGGASKFFSAPDEDLRPIHVVENYTPPDPQYVFYTDDVERLVAEQQADENMKEGMMNARMGFLPMPGELAMEEKNRPTWQKNAVQVKVLPNQKRIVIVIDDMGLNVHNTRRVMDLPAPLTLSFLPYAQHLPTLTKQARSKGHELMVHVPMEPMGESYDAGPAPLLTDLDKPEIMKRLRHDLDAFDGYVGINNHMGSKFTRDRQGMTLVLGELKRRGLLFLDSRTISGTVGKDVAAIYDLPFAARDVFLDHESTPEFVHDALAKTEHIAEITGIAIAIGHPKDVTISALEKWIPEARKRGFAIVPISNVITPSKDAKAQMASTAAQQSPE